MNYFYSERKQNNISAKYSLSAVPIKNVLPVFFALGNTVFKTGKLFRGIYFRFIKHESWMSFNVGKQEISFPLSIYKENKNSFSKNYSYLSTLLNSITMLFFERIPGLDVSSEKKTGCVRCPLWKICWDFYATEKRTCIKVINGLRGINHE